MCWNCPGVWFIYCLFPGDCVCDVLIYSCRRGVDQELKLRFQTFSATQLAQPEECVSNESVRASITAATSLEIVYYSLFSLALLALLHTQAVLTSFRLGALQ